MNFIATLIVSMLDPIAAIGYLISSLASKRLWVAIVISVAWRLSLGFALKMENGLAPILAAVNVTTILYFVKFVIRENYQKKPNNKKSTSNPKNHPSNSPTYHTALDDTNDAIKTLVIERYRSIAAENGPNFPPSSKTSDERLFEIYDLVIQKFQAIATERGEPLSLERLNFIAWYFMQVEERSGKDFFYDHLSYELDKFSKEGLRETYRRDIQLIPTDESVGFDSESAIENRVDSDLLPKALDIIRRCAVSLDLEGKHQDPSAYLPVESEVNRLLRTEVISPYDLALILVDAGYKKTESAASESTLYDLVSVLQERGATITNEMIEEMRRALNKALSTHDILLTKVSEVALLNHSKIIPQHGSVGRRMKASLPDKFRKDL